MKTLPLAALAAAALLTACAPPPEPPKPTTVALEIVGEPDMNGGAPVRVKVFYLKSEAAFQTADFFALDGNAAGVLGQDLIAVDEYALTPGGTAAATKSFDQPVPHIGAVAGLRDVDRPGWKATTALAPRAPNAMRLTVDGQGVKLKAAGN